MQTHTAPFGCGQPVFESGLDGGWCRLQKLASQKKEVEGKVGETNGSSQTRCHCGTQGQPKGTATWQLVEWICSSGLAWSCEPREWHRIVQESVCREQRTVGLAQAFSWRSASPDYLSPCMVLLLLCLLDSLLCSCCTSSHQRPCPVHATF